MFSPIFHRGVFFSFWTLFSIFLNLPLAIHAQDQAKIKSISAQGFPQAHAHNDYEHKVPLWEALSFGFNSVEADTWFLENQMYVKHGKPLTLGKTPSLSELYLEPLAKIFKEKESGIYPMLEQPFYLMIDLKNEGEASYKHLKKLLLPHHDLLAGANPPLKIFLSGNRPIELMKADSSYQLLSLDGRPGDLGKGYSASFMPVISQRYSKIISWKGKKAISQEDFQILKTLADKCHAEGKLLRLWASPETELCWSVLLDAGVDLINTDKLKELNAFLRKRNSK